MYSNKKVDYLDLKKIIDFFKRPLGKIQFFHSIVNLYTRMRPEYTLAHAVSGRGGRVTGLP